MNNKAMEQKLDAGEAIDVCLIGIRHPHFAGVWILEDFLEDHDYCNAEDERWIFSIGRSKVDGKIYAAEDNRFHENPAFDCLWLR